MAGRKRSYEHPRAQLAKNLHAKGMDADAIAERMGIKVKTVWSYTRKSGGTQWKAWTEREIAKLIVLWSTHNLTIPEIALRLSKTPNATIGKIWRLKAQKVIPQKRPISISRRYHPRLNLNLRRKKS